jgi:dTDP-4-dehydrorhamnose reductase
MSRSLKLLVIGAKGQLGWELCRRGEHHCFDVTGLDLPEFDITDPSEIDEALSKTNILLVINAAAYTAVDQAESEQALAFSVNCNGPAYLANSCSKLGIPLLHVSTDYVFDGSKRTPYLETDPVSPVSVYGESKAAGERAVRDSLEAHIILRTSWLYGVHGNNFVKTILRLANEREELRVVADQNGCPTHAGDLAMAILHVADQMCREGKTQWGTYHYCGQGITTWHDFAVKICELAMRYVPLRVREVKAISTMEYYTPAKRPPLSALDCSKIAKVFGISVKPWQESVADMLECMYA